MENSKTTSWLLNAILSVMAENSRDLIDRIQAKLQAVHPSVAERDPSSLHALDRAIVWLEKFRQEGMI